MTYTIVTGLWNLRRGELDPSFARSYDHYLEKFAELLKTPANMFIYVAKDDEAFIWQHREKHNTHVRIRDTDAFRTEFPFYDNVQNIRSQEEWYSQAGWLTESPQAKLELYNPMVMSKMFMLNDASLFNPFNSKYFYWVDAGITNTVHSGYFWHDKVFDNLPKYTDAHNKFIMLSYPYADGHEIHGMPRPMMNKYCGVENVGYVCRGGFFGGKKEHINELNGQYYFSLQNTISAGHMGTEENIHTILAHHYPDTVHRFQLGGDGMVWPFFEMLKNVDNHLPEKTDPAVSLYVLGYNSPKQFDDLCKSIFAADKALHETRKILVNNSTDTTTFEEYDRLCELHGFEEIHKDNIGICGGRQFVAEHFAESTADYYLFFEDDMQMHPPTSTKLCKSGFKTYVKNILSASLEIMKGEQLDFLKWSYSEFYGDNGTQWAWYNVPQHVRETVWPQYNKLPEHGLDPNSPRTHFDHIKTLRGTSYAVGQVYYSNWPQIVSRAGNQKMFLDTKWAHPYEQTWMSHIFQQTIDGNIKSAVFLASPINHDRYDHYPAEERREN